MFGSTNPFGSSSSSLFGTTSSFGATPSSSPFGSTQTTNPFGAKPFGSTFAGQTGSSIFGGGTSTGIFGATSSSFGTSTPAFGSSSTPAFGSSSTPAFGSSSTPAFGSTPTPFGAGSLTFGQKPATSPFGSFGATQGQTNPFGSPTFGQTQPAFGSQTFGSTPAFGSAATPAFGTSTPAFGATTSAFGASSSPAFGVSSAPAFGQSSAAFGSTSIFGQSAPSFGASTTPAFGTTSIFGSTSASPFGAQTSAAFGGAGTSTFGGTPFAGALVSSGSRITPYSPTNDPDAAVGTTAKLISISAMPAYKSKSVEELRWEDYQNGDKGGPSQQPSTVSLFGPATAQPNVFGMTQSSFGAQPSPSIFGSKPTFGSSSAPTFGSSTSSFSTGFGTTPFGTFGTGSSFGSSSSFGSPAVFGATTSSAFGSTTFGSTSSPFGTFGAASSFGSASAPTFGSSSLFAPSSSPFGSTTTFGTPQTTGIFTTPSASPFFNTTQSTFGSNVFGSSSIFSQPKAPALFAPSTPAQTSFSFPQATSSLFTPQTSFPSLGQQPVQSFGTVTPAIPVSAPFGTLPAMAPLSIGRTVGGSSAQYGISSIPVSDKSTTARPSSLLTPISVSPGSSIRMHSRRYRSKKGSPKQQVSFFSNEENLATPKADLTFIPREDPRALFIHKPESFSVNFGFSNGTVNAERDGAKVSHSKEPQIPDSLRKHEGIPIERVKEKEKVMQEENPNIEKTTESPHGTNVKSLMPKLHPTDYYTEPSIEELLAKERTESGYCSRVEDFIIGRKGYGFVKIFGETDVRHLDLESIIQFNKCEVLVYMDETTKPPVGQGINKPAEVTLLNVICFDKKTNQQYTEGKEVEKFITRLKKKTEQQGAEFVSYDAVKARWTFRVKHF